MNVSAPALLAINLLAVEQAPPVPGGCSAPAAENQNRPGCYLSAELHLATAPAAFYWQIYEAEDRASATAESKRHPLSRVPCANRTSRAPESRLARRAQARALDDAGAGLDAE